MKSLVSKLIGAFFVVLFCQGVFAVQFFYDDNSMDANATISSNAYVIKISPAGLGELESIEVYLMASAIGAGWAYVLDFDHNIVDSSLGMLFFNPDFSWKTYPISREFDSDFYVGFGKLLTMATLQIGLDSNNVAGMSEYSNNPTNNSSYVVDNNYNYMIRANFRYYPVVSGVLASPNPANANASLAAECTADDANVDSASFRIDAGTWSAMSAVDSAFDSQSEAVDALIDIGGLADGSHLIEVKCEDNFGKETGIAQYGSVSLVVDTVVPIASLDGVTGTIGDNNWFVSDVDVDFSASDPAPSSGIASEEYCTDTTGTCVPGTAYSGTIILGNEGGNYAGYFASDNAGNDSNIVYTGLIKIDKHAPYGQSVTLSPESTPGYSNSQSLGAVLDPGFDDVSGLRDCEFSWDANSWSSIGVDVNGLGPNDYNVDGLQTAHYRCYDNAGLVSQDSNVSIVIDTVEPESNITSPVADENISLGTILVQGTASDATSNVKEVFVKIEYFEEDGNWSTIVDWNKATGTTDWNFSWDNSSEKAGFYRFSSKAVDESDLEETTIDTVTALLGYPVINSVAVSPSSLIRGQSLLIDANVTDEFFTISSVSAVVSDGNNSYSVVLSPSGNIYSGTVVTSALWNTGTYVVTVDANNAVGNDAVSKSADLNVFMGYSFGLALNANPLTTGGNGIVSGQLLSDEGTQIGDVNVEIASAFFGPVIVVTDANGLFAYSFTTTSAGTFTIVAGYSDGNTNQSDSIGLTVNDPVIPPTPPSDDEGTGGGGGSGGGGGGSPNASALLRVSPSTIEVGESVDIGALCKWQFGCNLVVDGSQKAEMVSSAGFQEFSQSFSEPGTKIIRLYWKGTVDTLVAEKTVVVRAPEEEQPQEPEATAPLEEGTGNNAPALAVPLEEEQPQEPAPEQPTGPTGFFGLGGFDLSGAGGLGIIQLIGILIGLAMMFSGKGALNRRA